MIKRLSGGLILLNLTNISLGVTSGEVDITDKDILEQLTELRAFIDTNRDFSKGFKNLKPVLMEYRSSASKFNGVTQCNLSFYEDALHMSIGAIVNNGGKYLNITIMVEYESVDYLGYQVKTATINAYEKEALTGANIEGDVDITGDVNITGDVDITGDFTADEIVEKMSGYSFVPTHEGDDANLTKEFIYCGAVKNGNKLTLVMAVNLTRTGTISGTQIIGQFIVPSDVYAKLYPTDIGGYPYLALFNSEIWSTESDSVILKNFVGKYGNNAIDIQCFSTPLNTNLVENTKYYLRLEMTFLLSENLIPQD
ncbi:MAG: hypothetical protein J6T10_27200 [Methanobrevibacter sp.]|nr:hypothetical protein [Methanobrevibacter sp.]